MQTPEVNTESTTSEAEDAEPTPIAKPVKRDQSDTIPKEDTTTETLVTSAQGTCDDSGSNVNITNTDEGSVSVIVSTNQTASSGDVTNDGTGSTTSGDVKTCSSTNINVHSSN